MMKVIVEQLFVTGGSDSDNDIFVDDSDNDVGRAGHASTPQGRVGGDDDDDNEESGDQTEKDTVNAFLSSDSSNFVPNIPHFVRNKSALEAVHRVPENSDFIGYNLQSIDAEIMFVIVMQTNNYYTWYSAQHPVARVHSHTRQKGKIR